MPNACVKNVYTVWATSGKIVTLTTTGLFSYSQAVQNQVGFAPIHPQVSDGLIHSGFGEIQTVIGSFSPSSTPPITSEAN